MKQVLQWAGLALIALGLLKTSAYAQNTLQFDSVLLISSTNVTVPSDEVWKIVSLTTTVDHGYHGNNGCNTGDDDVMRMTINGSNYYFNSQVTHGSSGIYWGSGRFPFWLPPGTTVSTFCSNALLSIMSFKMK